MKIKKLCNRIYDRFGPWKYIGTVGIHDYYENRITKNRIVYSDYKNALDDERIPLDSAWLSKRVNRLGE